MMKSRSGMDRGGKKIFAEGDSVSGVAGVFRVSGAGVSYDAAPPNQG